VECLHRKRNGSDAVGWIENLRSTPHLAAHGYRLAARRLEVMQEIEGAIQELQRGLQQFVEDVEHLRELARFYHTYQNHSKAIEILERLNVLNPKDALAWNKSTPFLEIRWFQPSEGYSKTLHRPPRNEVSKTESPCVVIHDLLRDRRIEYKIEGDPISLESFVLNNANLLASSGADLIRQGLALFFCSVIPSWDALRC
jgi:tetratricopeptide (TPR) repeat protein